MLLDRPELTAIRRSVAEVRPRTAADLRGWLRAVLGIDVPRRSMCRQHQSPMDYLAHVFFERPGDVVVWANRGGGKTFYGAVATLLDLLFKPGIEVCILGGSFEQSARMYAYLQAMLDRPALRPLVDGQLTRRGVRLQNGSRVELAAQAQTSVRGHRVQKLRCDEIDLFDRDVWSAAQFVTRSNQGGPIAVRGSVECFSTMHRPYGLMNELVAQTQGELTDGGWRLIQWCALDVIERCEAQRLCQTCVLDTWCEGRAKTSGGFLPVEDAVVQRQRSGRAAFECEMLCRRPSRTEAVFTSFDAAQHVSAVEADPSLRWIGGMDFGIRNPFVMLWHAD